MRMLRANENSQPDLVDAFESRRAHAWNKVRWNVPNDVHRGRFLDIGCGIGNGLVAALQLGFQTAVGIDRDFKEFGWFDINDFDGYCRRYDVDPAQAVMVEGDLFKTNFATQGFDCVFMLDSIEHVPEPESFIRAAAQYVAPGGVLLVDTCPLYYSKAGGHLFNHFPPDRFPWVHLRRDFKDLAFEHKVDDWSMQRFEELNKVTHQAVRDAVVACGLEVVTEHRSEPSESELALLEATKPFLNLDGVDERLLFEDWLLIVGRRPLAINQY